MKLDEFNQMKPEHIDFILEDEISTSQSQKRPHRHLSVLIALLLPVIAILIGMILYNNRSVASLKQYVVKNATDSKCSINVQIRNRFKALYLKDHLSGDYLVDMDMTTSSILVKAEHAIYQIDNPNILMPHLTQIISSCEHDLSLLKDIFTEQSSKILTIVLTNQGAEEISNDYIVVRLSNMNDYDKTLRVCLLQSFYPDTIHYGLAYQMMQDLESWYGISELSETDSDLLTNYITSGMIDQLSFEQPVFTLKDLSDINVDLNYRLLREFVRYLTFQSGSLDEFLDLLMESATDYDAFRVHYEKKMNEWLSMNDVACHFIYNNAFTKPCSIASGKDTLSYPYVFTIDSLITCYVNKDFIWHQKTRFTYHELLDFLGKVPDAIYSVSKPQQMITVYFDHPDHDYNYGQVSDSTEIVLYSGEQIESVKLAYLCDLYSEKLKELDPAGVSDYYNNGFNYYYVQFCKYLITEYDQSVLIQAYQSSNQMITIDGKDIIKLYHEYEEMKKNEAKKFHWV